MKEIAMTQLGSSGLDVFPLALGTNTFGWTAPAEESFRILDAFVDGGGNLVDTADVYSVWVPGNGGGVSETVIGDWLASRGQRDRVMLSTKVAGLPTRKGLAPENVAAAAEDSLRRLRTDYIDVYYAHYDDPDTPLHDSIGAFAELVSRGVVRHVGLSNFTAERIEEWIGVASRDFPAAVPVTLQPHYNLVARTPYETAFAPLAARHNLGVVPYFGLAGGFLTGKYRSAGDAEGAARSQMVTPYLNDQGFAVVAALSDIAEETGSEPATVALAWLREQPDVVAPLASASRVEQLPTLLQAAKLTLTREQLDTLGQVSQPFAGSGSDAG